MRYTPQKWESIISESVKEILFDLKSFETHEYIVSKGKIGYKYQDEVQIDSLFGYMTMFAYFLENQKKKISDATLHENIGLMIRLGSFSFAEIPKQDFNSILDVTGTLSSLNKPERDIIKEVFKTKNKTFVPSVYGGSNLVVTNLIVVEEENHFFEITNEILRNRVYTFDRTVNRAVYVVFESIQKLKEYFNSAYFKEFRSEADILTEEANEQERKDLINDSTMFGKITWFARAFVRAQTL